MARGFFKNGFSKIISEQKIYRKHYDEYKYYLQPSKKIISSKCFYVCAISSTDIKTFLCLQSNCFYFAVNQMVTLHLRLNTFHAWTSKCKHLGDIRPGYHSGVNEILNTGNCEQIVDIPEPVFIYKKFTGNIFVVLVNI